MYSYLVNIFFFKNNMFFWNLNFTIVEIGLKIFFIISYVILDFIVDKIVVNSRVYLINEYYNIKLLDGKDIFYVFDVLVIIIYFCKGEVFSVLFFRWDWFFLSLLYNFRIRERKFLEIFFLLRLVYWGFFYFLFDYYLVESCRREYLFSGFMLCCLVIRF